MEIVIKDKQLALLLSNDSTSNAVYINYGNKFNQILPFEYNNAARHDLVIRNIPQEVLDKVKVLLELEVSRFTAFELIKPYIK